MLGVPCSKFAYAQARKVGIFELGGKHILRGSSLLMLKHEITCFSCLNISIFVKLAPLTLVDSSTYPQIYPPACAAQALTLM